MEKQSGQRQKSKIIVLVNNFESAKALVPAIATKKSITKSKGRFITGSKGRVVESKGVVLLNKKDTESAMEGFKSGKFNILVTTEADLSVLWEMRKMISMVRPRYLHPSPSWCTPLPLMSDKCRSLQLVTSFPQSSADSLYCLL
jgi:hypothetical protein